MENWVFNQIPPGLFKKNQMSYHLSFSICWAKSDLTDIPSKVIVFKLKVVNARRSGVNYPGTRLFSGEKRRITGEKKNRPARGKGPPQSPAISPLYSSFSPTEEPLVSQAAVFASSRNAPGEERFVTRQKRLRGRLRSLGPVSRMSR